MVTNIKFKIVNIAVKLFNMLGDLDVRIPIKECFVRYIEKFFFIFKKKHSVD